MNETISHVAVMVVPQHRHRQRRWRQSSSLGKPEHPTTVVLNDDDDSSVVTHNGTSRSCRKYNTHRHRRHRQHELHSYRRSHRNEWFILIIIIIIGSSMVAAVVIVVLSMRMLFSVDLNTNALYEFGAHSHSHSSNNIHKQIDPMEQHYYYRYSKIRLHSDIMASHQFLTQELRNVFSFSSSSSLSNSDRQKDHLHKPKPPQLIIGRFGTSESEIMEYATSTTGSVLLSAPPTNVTAAVSKMAEPIPANFYTPGYYFTNETTLAQRRTTVQQWGWQRIRSYSYMNLFAILDWSQNDTNTTKSNSYTLQMKGIQSYASKSGYIHANTIMYPPCLTIPKIRNDRNITAIDALVPWTLQLEHKIVLIVHPFIDSIRRNIPKLHSLIWANVSDKQVYGAPYSCFPNVTEFKFIRTPLPTKNNNISWLESLEAIKNKIDAVGYFDIALLGCGGYGLPLTSYISTMPFAPSAIYVGGALQLFFGIHGTRWSVPKYATNDRRSYYEMWSHVYNDAWIWPLWSDIENSTIGMIENGAYIQPNQAINQAAVQRHRWFDQ